MNGFSKICPKPEILIGLGLLATFLFFAVQARLGTAARKAGSTDKILRSEGAESSVPRIGLSDLGNLSWQQLPQAIRELGQDPSAKRHITLPETRFQNPVAVYLRALSLVAENKPEEALATFDRIGLESIPPLYQYAPFRLNRLLRPDKPNRYLPPLEREIAQGSLPALIRARVEAVQGRLEGALLSYTRSDPEEWKQLDLSMLSNIHRHAGLCPDADLLIRGALRAGRVSDPIRSGLLAIIAGVPASARMEQEQSESLRRKLVSDPALRELATAATVNQLAARKRFANREYAELLELHRHTDPKIATDETALLLLLSAARLENTRTADRWSQEIRRRFPSTEVKTWLDTLQ